MFPELIYRSAQGPLLLATNVLCWIVSAWFVYGIARRLDASPWIASCGILLYALSPCWYRDLIHSSFRTNGLAACFSLAAAYVLLKKDSMRSCARLMFVGILTALAAGSHEQGMTSLPIFVMAIIWLSFTREGGRRTDRIALATLAVCAPPLMLVSCFRLMNPMYGSNYVTSGFLGALSHSDRLASLGIHSPLVVGAFKLPVRVFAALISAMSAFTPVGGDNMARLNPYIGLPIFVLTMVASGTVMKRFPKQIIPATALILYAVGRSVGMPSAEPRFMLMEAAWGIIALVCALSFGFASGNRVAIITGFVAMLGLLSFSVVSYDATILRRQSTLLGRDEVDREAFHRIQSAARTYPEAQVILVNDHAAMWSARAMLELAGFEKNDFEILPTIIEGLSTDVLRNVYACPVSTQVLRLPTTLQVDLDYPAGCTVFTFGRDIACAAKRYQKTGRPYAAAWTAYLQQSANKGLFPPPLMHEVPLQPGRPLVVVAWRDRVSVPTVSTLNSESSLAIYMPGCALNRPTGSQ
jgi:hypothetical protein